jgi:hypothetical protein
MTLQTVNNYRWPASGRPPSPSRIRRQENPAFSPRLGPVPSPAPVRFPPRNWYSYHGYPRPIRWGVPLPLIPVPLPEPAPWRRLAPKIIFSLFPGLLYPLFLHWSILLYPRLRLTGKVLRPPIPISFFPEMLIVVLGVASVVVLQTAFALVFLRGGKKARSQPFRWGEVSVAGGLLAAGVYGVLRGFQYRPDDFFFLPPFALATAVFSWLVIAGTVLYSSLRREKADTPGPIRTADTRFRKPVLYPSELQGRGILTLREYSPEYSIRRRFSSI